jgi:hypothetical protein
VNGAAYPHPRAVRPDGEWSLIAEDHGVLRIFDDRSTPRAEADWCASYTTPVPFGVGSLSVILRGDGTHGIERVDATGLTVRRRDTERWSLLGNHGALRQLRDVDASGPRSTVTACSNRSMSGTAGCSAPACSAKHARLESSAIDVDADADDECVAGTIDGNLWCLKLDPDAVMILWRLPRRGGAMCSRRRR